MNIQVQICGLLIVLLLYCFYMSSKTLKLYTEKIFHQAMSMSMLCLFLDILSVVVKIFEKELREEHTRKSAFIIDYTE